MKMIKKPRSKINLDETLERFNKKKSKELTVNELQHEVAIIKEEIFQLKNEFQNIKKDNFDLEQELLLQKTDKQLDNQQSDSKPKSKEMMMAPANRLLFLVTLLLIINLVLLKNCFPQNAFQKSKFLFAMNMNSMLLIDSGADMNCIQEGMIHTLCSCQKHD